MNNADKIYGASICTKLKTIQGQERRGIFMADSIVQERDQNFGYKYFFTKNIHRKINKPLKFTIKSWGMMMGGSDRIFESKFEYKNMLHYLLGENRFKQFNITLEEFAYLYYKTKDKILPRWQTPEPLLDYSDLKELKDNKGGGGLIIINLATFYLSQEGDNKSISETMDDFIHYVDTFGEKMELESSIDSELGPVYIYSKPKAKSVYKI